MYKLTIGYYQLFGLLVSVLIIVFGLVVVSFSNVVLAFDIEMPNDVNLISDLPVIVPGAANSAHMSGTIRGSGKIIKQGDGRLELSNNNNDFAGGVDVTAGILKVSASKALGTGILTVDGGNLIYVNSIDVANVLNIKQDGSLTVDDSDVAIHSGQITGVGALTKNGDGVLELNNAGNDYSGGTNLNGGAIKVSASPALGSGDINGNGGDLIYADDVNVANALKLIQDTSVAVAGSDAATHSGQITGASALTKNGDGVLELNNAGNDYSGGTNLNGGAIKVSASPALGSGDINGNGGDLIYADDVNVVNALKLIQDTSVAVAGSDAATHSGQITGASALTKNGDGVLELNNAGNDYSGGTNLNGGAIKVSASPALGSGDINGNGGDLIYADDVNVVNALKLIQDTSVAVAGSDAATHSGQITGASALTKNGDGVLELNNAGNDYSGGTNLNGGAIKVSASPALGSGDINGNGGDLIYADDVNVANALKLIQDTSVAVAGSDAATHSGQITGASALTKNDDGILELNNAGNDYSGGTNLNGGAIKVSASPALGSGDINGNGGDLIYADDVNVANALKLIQDTSVAVAGSDAATHSGQITGASALTKNDDGILELNNAGNDYSGGTNLNGGAIKVSASPALGSGDINGNGGDLIYADDVNVANALKLIQDTSVAVAGSDAATHSGQITGASALTKNDDGILELNNAGNDYSGGTNLNGGAIKVSASPALGSGDINGNGGDLIYIEGINLNNRINLNNDLGLKIDDASATASQSGDITGAATLNKDGQGTLRIVGDKSYTGDTNINAGAIVLAGNVPGSQFNAATNTGLSGNGTAFGLDNSGTLTPGNLAGDYGQINFMQDIKLKDGSVYQVDVEPGGKTDLILADGLLNIENGAQLKINAAPGSYVRKEYIIATGKKGAKGNFSKVFISDNNIKVKVTYDGYNVKLVLDNQLPEPPPVVKGGNCDKDKINGISDPNQSGVAIAICNMKTDAPNNSQVDELVDAYNKLKNDDDLQRARNLLSGEGLTTLEVMAIDSSRLIMNSVRARLSGSSNHTPIVYTTTRQIEKAVSDYYNHEDSLKSDILKYSAIEPDPVAISERQNDLYPTITAWLSYYGNIKKIGASGSRPGYKSNNRGMTVGIDTRIMDEFIFGMAYGYTQGNYNMAAVATSANIKTNAVLAYIDYAKNKWKIYASFGYQRSNLNTSRTIVFPGYAAFPTAKASAHGLLASVDVDYKLLQNRIADVNVIAGVSALTSNLSAIREKNGKAAAMIVPARSMKSILTSLGLSAVRQFTFDNDKELKLGAEVAWLHELGDVSSVSGNKFVYSATPFKVIGTTRKRDRVGAKLKGLLRLNNNFEAYLSYEGVFGRAWNEHTGLAGINITW